MIKFLLRLVPSALTLVAALAAAAPPAKRPHESLLHVRIHKDDRTLAGRVTRGLGTLIGFDSKSHAYTLKLSQGIAEDKAVRDLDKRREVESVWGEGGPAIPHSRDFRSVSGLSERIAELQRLHPEPKEEHDAKKPLGAGNELAGTDYLESLRAFLKLRAYPYDRVDWDAYDRAQQHIAAMSHREVRGFSGTPQGRTLNPWTFVGPKNLNTPYQVYYGSRPSSGRINAIAYDPSNPNTYYLGGGQGGVWKSVDAGATWTALTDAWPFLSVSSIAVDPQNPKTIYVGTGDFHGELPYSFGLMKSTDGGQTWTNYGKQVFGDTAVSAILVDPSNSSLVTITTGRGQSGIGYVWQSKDGGKTWAKAMQTAAEWSSASIGIANSSGARSYYVAGGGPTGNVYRSDDKGTTWTKLSPTIGAGYVQQISIAASAVDAKTAYLMEPNGQKIYKTTDSGSTWTDITGSLPTYGGYDWSQSWYDFYIQTFKNGSKDDIFVGLIDVAESPDGGTTWQSVGQTPTGGALTHNDQHSFAFNPSNPNEVLIGNDGGIYKATRSGGTWSIQGLSKTLGVTMFYQASWHPTDPAMMIGGSQDNATPVCLDNLGMWENVAGGDGFWTAINPANTQVQYATIYGATVIQTTDGWNSEQNISPTINGEPTFFTTVLYQDPVNTRYVYLGTDHLWRYDLQTNSWQGDLGGRALSNGGLVYAVAVAPSNGNVIYTGSTDGQLFMSTNAGTSFRNIGNSSLPNRAITSISVNPTNPNDILVGLSGTGSGHLYRCSNTASPTFTPVGGSGTASLPDLPLNCIERDPFDKSKTWYVGTDLGVFKTTNSGGTWQNLTEPLGLPNVQVVSINANKATGYLSAATYGRGIWRRFLGTVSALSPSTFTVPFGSFVSGGIPSLATVDGQYLTLSSKPYARLDGEIAGIDAVFTLSSPSTLGGMSLTVAANSSIAATEQVYVKNFQTGQFELLQQSPLSATTSSQTYPIGANGTAPYVNGSGQVEVLIRGYRSRRLGGGFNLNIDQAVLNAQFEG